MIFRHISRFLCKHEKQTKVLAVEDAYVLYKNLDFWESKFVILQILFENICQKGHLHI